MSRTACCRILAAIEADTSRFHSAGATRPRLLGPGETDQLLAQLAAELSTLIPGTSTCWLAAPGALLDQTQVLRPGYPAFRALESVARKPGAGQAGARLGVAAENGRLTPGELQPLTDLPLGILQLLPVVVCGPGDSAAALGAEMEHRFLDTGQISAHTALWLERAFAIPVKHARFMTLTDLNAMFRLQLEHFGLLPLWELIDAALNDRGQEIEVRTGQGQVFTWREGAVHAEFQTFDYWACSGLGRQIESARGQLAGGYADWTRSTRQYLMTLSAHGIPVELHLPAEAGCRVEGTFFVETGRQPPPSHSAAVTEHSFGELGTVCITTVQQGRQEHHYPLAASGLNDIQSTLRERDLGDGAVAYPGSILYDPNSRTLVPDRDEQPPGRTRP
jgi:hypothetical protein